MSAPRNKTCSLCKLPLRAYHEFITCSRCETSYHVKCWNENGGCALCDVVTAPAGGDPVQPLSWYLYHGNRNLGPLTWAELCRYPGIQPGDLVWNSRLPDWIRADQVPNLPLEEGLAGEPGIKMDRAAREEVKSAIPPAEKEDLAGEPLPADDSAQWQTGGTDYRLSPGPEPESGVAVEEAAPAAAEGDRPPASGPPNRTFKWKLVGAAGNWETSRAEYRGEAVEDPPRDHSRAEQIIDRLYEDQPADSTSEQGYAEQEEDRCDRGRERRRKSAGPLLYGILPALGVAIAAAAIYIHFAGWEVPPFIAAVAAAGNAALTRLADLFRGLFGS